MANSHTDTSSHYRSYFQTFLIDKPFKPFNHLNSPISLNQLEMVPLEIIRRRHGVFYVILAKNAAFVDLMNLWTFCFIHSLQGFSLAFQISMHPFYFCSVTLSALKSVWSNKYWNRKSFTFYQQIVHLNELGSVSGFIETSLVITWIHLWYINSVEVELLLLLSFSLPRASSLLWINFKKVSNSWPLWGWNQACGLGFQPDEGLKDLLMAANALIIG